METGTKNEVTVQEGAGFAEKIENVGHRSILSCEKVDRLAHCCGSINFHYFYARLLHWFR